MRRAFAEAALMVLGGGVLWWWDVTVNEGRAFLALFLAGAFVFIAVRGLWRLTTRRCAWCGGRNGNHDLRVHNAKVER